MSREVELKVGDVWINPYWSQRVEITKVTDVGVTYKKLDSNKTDFTTREGFVHFYNVKGNKSIKPPLGVMPKRLFIEGRITDLKECIQRYLGENREINMEWVEEYNELIGKL